MLAAYLPGNRNVDLRRVPDPVPGEGQVLLARRWGRVALVGEGGRLNVDVSEAIIHRQLTVHGSSTVNMTDLLERLDRWGLHPADIVTHGFPLSDAAEAYRLADSGVSGKIGIVWQD